MTKNEFDKAVSKLFYISGYGLPDKRIFDYVTDFVYTSICDKYSDQEIEHVFVQFIQRIPITGRGGIYKILTAFAGNSPQIYFGFREFVG